jgi:hypothetical protein
MFYFQKKFIIFNPLEQFEINTIFYWFSHKKSINFIKRFLFKLNNFLVSSSFLTDLENITLLKDYVLEMKSIHQGQVEFSFDGLKLANDLPQEWVIFSLLLLLITSIGTQIFSEPCNLAPFFHFEYSFLTASEFHNYIFLYQKA